MKFPRHNGWYDRLVIAVAALASLLAMVILMFAPRDASAGIGVVFAPWVSQEEALTRAAGAGARVVRESGVPFVVVVIPETDDYAARAAAAGALFLVDPRALDACLPAADATGRAL